MTDTCGVCGVEHLNRAGLPACARHKTDGSACRKSPMEGLKVCDTHGGRSPSGQKRHHATVAARVMGLDPVLVAANPLAALSAYAGETAQQYSTLRDELADMLLTADDAVYTDKAGVERIRAKVQLYERVCDRTERVLEALAKLNIDERLTRLEEAKVAFVIAAVEAAMEESGCDVDQRERARLALVRRLAGRPQLH